jgi:hypothetical protein
MHLPSTKKKKLSGSNIEAKAGGAERQAHTSQAH